MRPWLCAALMLFQRAGAVGTQVLFGGSARKSNGPDLQRLLTPYGRTCVGMSTIFPGVWKLARMFSLGTNKCLSPYLLVIIPEEHSESQRAVAEGFLFAI